MMEHDQINVILFGPSGINKRAAASNLEAICKSHLPSCRVQRLDITDFLETSIHVFLKRPVRIQQEITREAIRDRIHPKLSEADLNIISLHATLLCTSIPVFPCLSESVELLSPDITFTLLDDVYACKARLEKNGYPFRFSQLLAWRQIECGMADHFAQVLKIENVYLAAKHPRITWYRLAFEPQKPRVYSASQITEPRKSPELIAEIEKHRRKLHTSYVVFDPLTLDDRLLINNIPREIEGDTTFQIAENERWPCNFSDLGNDFLSLVSEDTSVFPITIDHREALALKRPVEGSSRRNVIDAQIRYRDFRYIDQSDVVSAYRPYLNGHESSGVAAEKTYSAGSGERAVVEFSPKADLETLGSKPFSTPLPGPICYSPDEFYKQLEEVAAKEALRRYKRNKQKYLKFENFRNKFQTNDPKSL
ncbi:MAG: hypothetical protein JXM79_19730 [Sedimentisphaerales bacterium]|nr:hypothetical protein [Sedimentisphaerales bacterium]